MSDGSKYVLNYLHSPQGHAMYSGCCTVEPSKSGENCNTDFSRLDEGVRTFYTVVLPQFTWKYYGVTFGSDSLNHETFITHAFVPEL